MIQSKLSYRAEIDGLRAIAVVSVILYHAQMVLFGRDWFEGGFIGVDIFFVISGYLITRIILSELESKGSFSFLNFYERRARRILPMLFVVIFVSVPYAWQKLLPSDFVEYAESILASLFFGSNFFFYFSTTEYGADSALLKPFLHTWSLGVEEQFYLFFPILAIVAFKYFHKHFLTILIGLSLLSLQFAELMDVRNADLNFYLPFSRFWELAVGSMLAYRELYYKPSNEGFASKSLPMFGLYLIAYSILFFDAKTPHPSFHTLIPIIGVVLIIGFASKDELVGKLLGSKPFVWVGLISYSAYLWHFPIFAFSRMGNELTNYDKLELVFLTLLLSVISYFLVEQTFRNSQKVSSKHFIPLIFIAVSFLSVLSIYAIKTEGFSDRLEGTIAKDMSDVEWIKLRYPPILPLNPISKGGDEAHIKGSCYERGAREGCIFGSVEFITLGDSFVGALEPTLLKALHKRNIGLQTNQYTQCGYLSQQYSIYQRSDTHPCPKINAERDNYYASLPKGRTFIVFHAPYSFGQLASTEGQFNSTQRRWDDHFQQLQNLLSMGHRVVFIYGVPHPKTNSRLQLHNLMISEYSGGDVFGQQTKGDVEREYEFVLKKVRALENNSDFVPINASDVLCEKEGKERCYDFKDGLGPIFNNGQHLSYLGAHLVTALLLDRLGVE